MICHSVLYTYFTYLFSGRSVFCFDVLNVRRCSYDDLFIVSS